MVDMNDTFAKRLLIARKIRCVSRRRLCELLEGIVSLSIIEKFEKAQMMPSSDVLIVLSRVLDFNIDYFFRPFSIAEDSIRLEFRKQSLLGAKMTEAIRHLVVIEIEKYLEIEVLLGIDNQFRLDYSDAEICSKDDAKSVALRLRMELNVGLDSIASVTELLESNGIKVVELETDQVFSEAYGFVSEIPLIVINKSITPERKRLSISRELGHLLLHFSEGVDEDRLCTVFASEFLIPSEKFVEIIGSSRHDISLVEMQAIQREYGISVNALMNKAVMLGVISQKQYLSYFTKMKTHPEFRELVDGSNWSVDQTSRFTRLVYRALDCEIISISKAAALLGCSVSDVRNKRNPLS